jgi:hypothetical protein
MLMSPNITAALRFNDHNCPFRFSLLYKRLRERVVRLGLPFDEGGILLQLCADAFTLYNRFVLLHLFGCFAV